MVGFFVLRPVDARLATLLLAKFTGWSKAEILAMDGEELMDWINTIPTPKESRRDREAL